MTKSHNKLANSLAALKLLQAEGRRVFQSNEFGRTDRERLIRNGFLQEIMKGWVISASPDTRDGDSTPWFTSFWQFCANYCQTRFGSDWYLSPEQSLLLHAGNTAIPNQTIIYSSKGSNNTLNLPFNTSLYDLKKKDRPQKNDLEKYAGLNIYTIPAALIKVSENFYQNYPIEAQVVLSSISDASDLLHYLLNGGHSIVAGRIAGAMRRIGKSDIADDIISTMKAADYDIRVIDPFNIKQNFAELSSTSSPIAKRVQTFWESYRQTVINIFPPEQNIVNCDNYLKLVDETYKNDAYHSLSIEGYHVTPELIDRVRSGSWNPNDHDMDRQSRDVLAARGYWQAFQLVKQDVANIITETTPWECVARSHRDWYREMFQPCVAAGLIGTQALAGYRNDAVFIRNSRHVPPRKEAVRDAMPALFDLLKQEKEASVRAVLGHWLFGYIHPYPDGNGRMARFLMNVMLASGGYPWTVIRVDDRDKYMASLEAASVDMNIEPFARFIAEQVLKPVGRVTEK